MKIFQRQQTMQCRQKSLVNQTALQVTAKRCVQISMRRLHWEIFQQFSGFLII